MLVLSYVGIVIVSLVLASVVSILVDKWEFNHLWKTVDEPFIAKAKARLPYLDGIEREMVEKEMSPEYIAEVKEKQRNSFRFLPLVVFILVALGTFYGLCNLFGLSTKLFS